MKRWYIVTTYSGYENSVKTDLERRRESYNMTHLIHQVLVPEEIEEVVDKKGNKKEKVNKIFPGYVFVEMEVSLNDKQEIDMDEDLWFMVRNTPKVTGFLGSSGGGTKPVPVARDEMNAILRNLGMIAEPKLEIEVGDKVEVVSGSFKDQVLEVTAINVEKKTLTVLVDFLGRATPMDINISDVKKLG